MKRILNFQMSDNKYVFIEDETVVFEIDITDLQFNVKAFYEAFFADDLDYSEIELKNLISNNNDATRVFKCVEQLMKEIIEKLNTELLDSGDTEE